MELNEQELQWIDQKYDFVYTVVNEEELAPVLKAIQTFPEDLENFSSQTDNIQRYLILKRKLVGLFVKMPAVESYLAEKILNSRYYHLFYIFIQSNNCSDPLGWFKKIA